MVDSAADLLPADVIIVATPLEATIATLESLVPNARDAVVLDTASVRAEIARYAERAAGARLVGLHPMAGGTARGFGAARADLFQGRPMLVVPTPRSDTEAMALAGRIARDAGGIPSVVGATEHDRLVAVLSGLPLVVASALALVAAEKLGSPLDGLAGPGFRDTTRLASTPPDFGSRLLAANAENLEAAVAALRDTLGDMERAIAARDTERLRELLARAAEVREKLS